MTARRSIWGAGKSEHDLRYDRADEFMEIVLGHWNAWGEDALVLDKQTPRLRRAISSAASRAMRVSNMKQQHWAAIRRA
jgi:alkanesulfonate monooxygenase SsuD/methylene tetrahydromethanopterin reductase-like flavin-dependent oxidoreductase (luciferase family)